MLIGSRLHAKTVIRDIIKRCPRDVLPENLVDIYRRFIELLGPSVTLKMDAEGSSETSVCLYRTTRCHIRKTTSFI